MNDINSDVPVFRLYVGDLHVGTMYDPQVEDMFWCSYRIEPTNDAGDCVLHRASTWDEVSFVTKDMNGVVVGRDTFAGAHTEFVARETERLWFRSLWPAQRTLASRIRAAITAFFSRLRPKPDFVRNP